jgi:hypothetical protein
MKNGYRNHFTNLLIMFVATFIFAVGLVLGANAQSSKGPVQPVTNDHNLQLREMQMRSLELTKESEKKLTREVSPETLKNVQEDFSRIQSINADIMRAYASGAAPNFASLAQATAEINKRATRLRANLMLPEPSKDTQEQKASTEAQPKSPLMALNYLIVSFVTNPIFKNDNTIDADLGTKAKRDLDAIVDLSDKISKSAEKLSKSSGKPR